jgi:glucose-6-phosphate dehydrogenase assembly protein OpcA
MPVDVASIEAEFDRIWEESDDTAYDKSSVRLRVSNFVAWATQPEAGERFERVMETLAQSHPCRGMLALAGGTGTALEAAISAHCWRTAGGDRHICSEEILLRGRRGGDHELASALLALLVPELPVDVWLLGEPDALRLLPEEVRDVADRVYVDSAAASVVGSGLRAILQADAGGDVVVVDLAWQRAGIWRDLIAQLFDSALARSLLDQITGVRMEGGSGQLSSSVLLLAGWMTSRLGLSAASIQSSNTLVSATYYDGTRGVEVRCAPSPGGAEVGHVMLLTPEAELYVELHQDSGHLHVRSSFAPEPVHRMIPSEPSDDAFVLLRGLDDVGDPSVYQEALAAAVELLDT